MKKQLIRGLLTVTLMLLGSAAFAQQPILTVPTPGTTAGGGNVSSTITVTNTFQQLWPASPSPLAGGPARHGCSVQNNGTHTMWVSEGLGLAASTAALSATVAAGTTWYCQVGGVALQGQINITGTSGDAFYAAQY